ESAEGHGGWCWHMGEVSRSVMSCGMTGDAVARREASFMAAPRCDKSVGNQCCLKGVDPQGFRGTAPLGLRTRHPRGRFSPTALSIRVVRGGRIGLVRPGGPLGRRREREVNGAYPAASGSVRGDGVRAEKVDGFRAAGANGTALTSGRGAEQRGR